jgi:ferredoxin-NADP reductase
MLQEFQTATVVDIINETYNTKRFVLQMENNPFSFAAGQFITLDLPISDKKNKRLRSYSIASAPNDSNIIELVIVLLPGGLGTSYLFTQVQIGSQITCRGPLGHFVLPSVLPADLFLICTGTGIAPFRSMVHYIQHQNIAYNNLYLIFGCRTQQDLLYHTELTALQQSMTGFHYLPTLSRENNAAFGFGYVHDIYLKHCKEKPAAEFMLCGWRAMIDQAREQLTTLGYDKKQVHFELYG